METRASLLLHCLPFESCGTIALAHRSPFLHPFTQPAAAGGAIMADDEEREERVEEPVVAVKEESLIQQSDLRCVSLCLSRWTFLDDT